MFVHRRAHLRVRNYFCVIDPSENLTAAKIELYSDVSVCVSRAGGDDSTVCVRLRGCPLRCRLRLDTDDIARYKWHLPSADGSGARDVLLRAVYLPQPRAKMQKRSGRASTPSLC